MSAFVRYIVHAILARIKRFFIEFKIRQSKKRVEMAREESSNAVKKANESFDSLMSEYDSYVQSKGDGVRPASEEVRRDGEDPKDGDR